MSEKEIWEKFERMGRIIWNPKTEEYTVSSTVYDILGRRRKGIRNLDELAIKFRLVWPAGVKSGGLYVRSGITTIQNKLRVFFKRYPHYTDDEVLAAAQRYVDESRRDNYQYMKTAEYFILKNDGSTLETYCEIIKANEVDKPQQNIRTA